MNTSKNDTRNTLITFAKNGDMSAVSKLCYLGLSQDNLNISSPKIDIITEIDNDKVLKINVRCYEKLEQNVIVNSIYKGIVYLDFNNITNIMISVYSYSNIHPTWIREFTSLQLLQKFCDSTNNNKQTDFPASLNNNDFKAQKSNHQTNKSIQTDNMKNNNIALISSIIFSLFFALIFLYGLFGYFTASSVVYGAEFAELQRIRNLLIMLISMFLVFQVDLFSNLRK